MFIGRFIRNGHSLAVNWHPDLQAMLGRRKPTPIPVSRWSCRNKRLLRPLDSNMAMFDYAVEFRPRGSMQCAGMAQVASREFKDVILSKGFFGLT